MNTNMEHKKKCPENNKSCKICDSRPHEKCLFDKELLDEKIADRRIKRSFYPLFKTKH